MNVNLKLRRWFCGGIAGIVLLCLAVPAAIAIPITYVFSGPATGTLGATPFTGAQVTITATADTANITTLGGVPTDPCINLTGLTINIAGIGNATAIAPGAFVDVPSLSLWALLSGSCSMSMTDGWLDQINALAASYGLITAIGPTTGTPFIAGSVATTSGLLTFATIPLTFQATLSTLFTADQSDIWYTAGESGWAIQIIHRGSVIFATLYVYDPNGNPTWYVATMNYTSNLTWTGDLYATTGPYFGTVPFNPANVVATKVGTMTWTAQTVETGTLTYVVNGVTIVKNVVRYTLVFDDFSGHYAGGLHDIVTGCPNAAANGTFDFPGFIVINQHGTAVTIVSSAAMGLVCTYTGTLTQAGQMGAIPGAAFICTDGSSGAVSFDELQINRSSISGTFTATYSVPLGCHSSGWFGGFRGTTF